MSEELTLQKVKENIFWADYYKESYKFKDFNIRKHGVTINDDFLSVLANNQYLTAQHFVFFQGMFSYYFGEFLVLSLDCHVFTEFIPDVSNTILSNMMVTQYQQKSTPNLFQMFESQYEQEQQSTQETQSQNNSIFQKTLNLIKFLNPLRFLRKSQPQQDLNLQDSFSNQFSFSYQNEVSQQKELLQKYNFQVKSISYEKKDQQEPTQGIAKGEMKINNVIILENEKGKYQFNKLNIQIKNLKEKYKFSTLVQKNIFSLFKYTYIPINLQNNHWLCAIVDFNENQIQYLDSNYQIQNNVVEGLEQMQNYQGEQTKWQIIEGSPKQENSFDCGIFCLMALYQLYKKGKLIQPNSYNQQDINSFRKQLLHLAVIESQHDINQKLLNIILDFKHPN
ncbi:unnamed protein product (macronuclear) [Paramecium tetraurelia]|uniref:Ubiquitin-like protease family profile domain-containing protein n=1 Tax=Paramecium tetraurelia TaxID=5888 RepID=A0DTP1_PARTE|nr:uncharacterized protein GSPATT00020089001 [Paramecium tetraurelia]CAK86408.1 unnamed protein product [Paramecium tetraurelia]|eukprot:XP_001453805.1 hypothetical protein (macronuclear) [Paramecium tetraurelia strain d4-2]